MVDGGAGGIEAGGAPGPRPDCTLTWCLSNWRSNSARPCAVRAMVARRDRRRKPSATSRTTEIIEPKKPMWKLRGCAGTGGGGGDNGGGGGVKGRVGVGGGGGGGTK